MDLYIYSLIDPFSKMVMYIGCTKNLDTRLYGHIAESKDYKNGVTTDKDMWIKHLLSCGRKPVLDVIGKCSNVDSVFCEQYWIAYYRCINPNLLNKSIGGNKHNLKTIKPLQPC